MCTGDCIPKDPKNPSHWKQWRLCETLTAGHNPFKEAILDICDQRQDDLSSAVFIRLQAVLTSLPAYDGQYHKHCYNQFRKIPKNPTISEASKPLLDLCLQSVADMIEINHKTSTWTSAELYKVYTDAKGDLTSKQMLNRLCDYFGQRLVVISIPGCQTEIGLREHIGSKLKMVRISETVEDDIISDVVHQITSEVANIPCPKDYNLADFRQQRAIEDTSKSLLKLVSKLVSNGEITKKSLSLSQCIQQHIGQETKRNQTTLGLALKLHHKLGSREAIMVLSEHGITCSYDEVLHFRK